MYIKFNKIELLLRSFSLYCIFIFLKVVSFKCAGDQDRNIINEDIRHDISFGIKLSPAFVTGIHLRTKKNWIRIH